MVFWNHNFFSIGHTKYLEILLHKVQYKHINYLHWYSYVCRNLPYKTVKAAIVTLNMHTGQALLYCIHTIGLRKHNAYFSWFHINSNKHSNTTTHTTAENSIILYVRKRIASRPMAILRTKPGPWSWPSLFCISYWSYIVVLLRPLYSILVL